MIEDVMAGLEQLREKLEDRLDYVNENYRKNTSEVQEAHADLWRLERIEELFKQYFHKE